MTPTLIVLYIVVNSLATACDVITNPSYSIPGLGNPAFYGDFPLDVCTYFCTEEECISSWYTSCDERDTIWFQRFNNTDCKRYDHTDFSYSSVTDDTDGLCGSDAPCDYFVLQIDNFDCKSSSSYDTRCLQARTDSLKSYQMTGLLDGTRCVSDEYIDESYTYSCVNGSDGNFDGLRYSKWNRTECIGSPTVELVASPSVEFVENGESRTLTLIHGCGQDMKSASAIVQTALLCSFIFLLHFYVI
mmetsp:Transcript_33982/g.55418  ORF Transcript_33982/g.55418 Transcript_33982/m.55418 type:complete len:245 (+) Transcript_33982:48-782(+)